MCTLCKNSLIAAGSQGQIDAKQRTAEDRIMNIEFQKVCLLERSESGQEISVINVRFRGTQPDLRCLLKLSQAELGRSALEEK